MELTVSHYCGRCFALCSHYRDDRFTRGKGHGEELVKKSTLNRPIHRRGPPLYPAGNGPCGVYGLVRGFSVTSQNLEGRHKAGGAFQM